MKSFAQKWNKKIYYGWVIVLISGMTFFFSAPGQTYSISVFIDAYKEEFGFSSTLISSGYSIATMISGLLLIFMGKAVDKYGPRKMLIIVALLLGLTTLYSSFVTNIILIFIGFFFLRYFGQGSMTLIPNYLIPQWFEEKRAFAISLAGVGNLLATLSVPALNLWMITRFGWESAWRMWSIILLVGFIPLVILLVINKPEDIKILMENKGISSDQEVKISLERMASESFTLKQAIHTKEFWIVGFISTIPSMFTTGFTFHFLSMMALRGVPKEEAVIIIGLVALPAFFMPFIARLVIDKYPAKYVLFYTLLVVIACMGWLAWAVSGMPSAILFILVYGAAVAIQGVTLSVLWPNYFGRKYLGSIRGAATVFMVLGSALGPLPFGIIFDLTGNYNPVIVGMMVYTFIATVLTLLIKKPSKKIELS